MLSIHKAKQSILNPLEWMQVFGGFRARSYQREVARTVIASVLSGGGQSLVVLFPRQSGKNELQAQIEAYLLYLFSTSGMDLVKISPTWRPQSQNAMRRLERVLEANRLTRPLWEKESGYIYRLGGARMIFLSGAPEAHIVGATARLLLEVDEAQDVLPQKYDKEIAPMAASTNATRVFWGTAWTSQTLLGRELAAAREAERLDGIRRAWVLSADEVGREVPAYAEFVAGQVARLGRSHPLVRTQFFSEMLDAETGMFPAARLALMQGVHLRCTRPPEGAVTALLLDVAGEDEGISAGSGELKNPARDATALTVVQVDRQPGLPGPLYRVLDRRTWLGVKLADLYGQILALAEHWRAQRVVVDATGVGAGLASFLERALPGRVIPFVFTQVSKSNLGWSFLAVCDSGRFRDWLAAPEDPDPLQRLFWAQAAGCDLTVLPGPERRIRWGVPDQRRDPYNGELLHDDVLLSAALCALLDDQVWMAPAAEPLIVRACDPLADLDRGF